MHLKLEREEGTAASSNKTPAELEEMEENFERRARRALIGDALKLERKKRDSSRSNEMQ